MVLQLILVTMSVIGGGQYDASQVETKLSWSSSKDLSEQIKALEKLILSCRGYKLQDRQEIATNFVQLSISKDPRVKKLVYLYLTLVLKCEPDIILHIMNSASNDLMDPNPLIRSSTLRYVSELPFISDIITEFVCSAILSGLQDQSPRIRCIAVNGVIQAYHHCHDSKALFNIKNFTNMLELVKSIMQRDPNPSVVVRCVECLAVCERNSKLVQDAILSLVDRAALLDSQLILVVLHRANTSLNYRVLDEEELFKMLNKLESFRNVSTCYSIAIVAMCMMIKISGSLENVLKDLVCETVSSFISLYVTSNDEVKFLVLCDLVAIANIHRSLLRDRFICSLNNFLVLREDSCFTAAKKMEILSFCITHENALDIYINVRPYLHMCLSNKVVKAAFNLLEVLYEFLPETCLNAILSSLYSSSPIVAEYAVVIFYHVTVGKKHKKDHLSRDSLRALMHCYSTIKSHSSKSSLLWLVSQTEDSSFSKKICSVVSTEISTLCLGNSGVVYQLCVLNSATKCFLKWPSLFHVCLRELLKHLQESNQHSFVRDRAQLYYSLLKVNLPYLKTLLNCGDNPTLVSETKSTSSANTSLNEISTVSSHYDSS